MKNLYKYIVLLAAALTCSAAMNAQPFDPGKGLDGIVFNKDINDLGNHKYEIIIDAFVTGTRTEEYIPCAITLVLDVSTSMSASQYSSGYFTLDTPQELTTGDNIGILHTDQSGHNDYSNNHDGRLRYQIEIGGERYNLIYKNKKWYYGNGTTWNNGNGWKEYSPNKNHIIYTDVKIDLLQNAAAEFVKQIKANTEKNNVAHRVGVTTFCGNLLQYCNLAPAKDNSFTVYTRQYNGSYSTKTQSMTDFMADLHNHMDGSTNHYLGIQKAEDLYKTAYGFKTRDKLSDVLKSDEAKKHKQILVIFTDGDPNGDQLNCVTKTIESTYAFKSAGASVYTVGIFTDTDIKNTNLKLSQFLDYSSSNYPNAKTYGTYGQPINPKKYYFKAEGSDLESIFDTIAEETSDAKVKLNASTTTTKDIVSENFIIPESTPNGNYDGTKYGTTERGNAIGLYVAKVNGFADGEYTFDSPVLAKGAKDGGTDICPNINAKVTGNNLEITGFDYAKYCVAEVTGASPKTYKGYKLIIKLLVGINPDCPGGASLPSNGAGSGIYSTNPLYNGQVAEFQRPGARIPNIVIVKKGLKKGESATFTVTGVDEDGTALTPMNLVATCGADGADAIAKAKIQKPGRYTVTENTWSWAYSVSELVSSYTKEDSKSRTTTNTTDRSITRSVNENTEDSTYKGTPFIFKNAAKTGTPDHGESYKVNVFSTHTN